MFSILFNEGLKRIKAKAKAKAMAKAKAKTVLGEILYIFLTSSRAIEKIR